MRVGARAAVLLLGAGLALSGGCNDTDVGRADGTLEVEKVVDFGTVPVGRNREARLKLLNKGRSRLHLGDCTFDAPSPKDFALGPLADSDLGPGESVELTLSFAPGIVGVRATRLRVPTQSGDASETTVEIRGEGVLGRAEPGTTRLDFGKVAVQSESTLTFDLTNNSDHTAEVVVPRPDGDDGDDFFVDPTGPVEVAPHSTRSVAVAFRPLRVGLHEASIALQPCPSCAPEPIALVGEGIAATLVANPPSVDFGFVEPGMTATRQVVVTNLGTQPATLRRVFTSQATGNEFTVPPLAQDVVLGENESHTIDVSFTPPTLDPKEGSLRVEATAARAELLVIPLKGYGGGPDIDVRPNPLGFPRTGVGVEVEKKIVIRNIGHDPGNMRPLRVTAVYVDGATSQNGGDFRLTLDGGVPVGPLEIRAGDSASVFVRVRPSAEGQLKANIHIESNDGDEPLVIVPVTASAKDLGPCDWQVVPQVLDFGAVGEAQPAVLSFAFRNVGENDCALSNVRLSRSTPPVFTLAPISTRLIEPGGQLLIPVTFTPSTSATYSGLVEFDVSSPANPHGEVQLMGRGTAACLEIEPQTLDFGSVGLSCQPPIRSVAVRNTCGQAVDVFQSYIGTGSSEEFELQSGGGATTLAPGGEMQLAITYSPVDEGVDDAPLFVDTSLEQVPFLVPLHGTGNLRPSNTDTFVQPPLIKVDVLFVIDNSGSLMEEQDALSRNFDRFIQSANARGVDFQIAVTTTGLTPYKGGWSDCPGGVDGGEAGRFFPVDGSSPRILTPTTPNLRDVFARNVKVGVCHWWEEGLEASRLALSTPLIDNADAPNYVEPNDGNAGFLRPDAKLYVIYVSDEEDAGTRPTDDYVTFMRGLKPGRPDLVGASAIVGLPSCGTAPSVGSRYISFVTALGGQVADICSPDWGGLLQRIGDEAFTARTVFPLTQFPDGRDIKVTVDGNEVLPQASDGSLQWRYDPTVGDYGAVVFEPGHAPGANATVTINYPVPCPPAVIP